MNVFLISPFILKQKNFIKKHCFSFMLYKTPKIGFADFFRLAAV